MREPATVTLGAHAYGKAGIHLIHVADGEHGEILTELRASVRFLEGIEEAYLEGANARLVTTDAMRNLVYEVCTEALPTQIEEAGIAILGELARCYPHLPMAEVDLETVPWSPAAPRSVRPSSASDSEIKAPQLLDQVTSEERERIRHAHVRDADERQLATVSSTSDPGTAKVVSGIEGITFLLSARNSFEGFLVDRHTTSSPTSDRAVSGHLRVSWIVAPDRRDWAGVREALRSRLLAGIASEPSGSLQHLLTVGAQRVLESVPAITSIRCELDSVQLVPIVASRGDRSSSAQRNCRAFAVVAEPHGVITVSLDKQPSDT